MKNHLLFTTVSFKQLLLTPLLLICLVSPGLGSEKDVLRTPLPEITKETKIGLTLSGGGAKGFAHLGIIKVLEEVGMPIDYITGTSMGALVGGLYAMGYSTDFIEKIAVEMDWNELFSDSIRRRHIPIEEKEWDSIYLLTLPIVEWGITLPVGVVAGQRIEMLLNRLTWPYWGHQNFLDFPIPFTCVATDIETGEAVVINEGFPAEAIRASISIPSVFMPKRIDDRLLVDGGVVRNLPVEEIKMMGADIVIAVNVSSPLKAAGNITNIMDIMDQTVSFQISESMNRSKELANIVLENHDIFSHNILDFDSAKEMIDMGEKLARAHYDKLKALADQLNEARQVTPTYPVVPSNENRVFISDINVVGVQEGSATQVKSKLMLFPQTYVSLEEIVYGVENIYGMQFYNSVTYKLIHDEAVAGAYHLQVEVQERQQDLFRFGFNYDNYRRASILLNTTFRNLLYPNSVTRLNVKLGEEPSVDGRFFNYLTNESNLALSFRANYSLHSIDIFNADGNRLSSLNTNSFFLESMVVPFTNNNLLYSVGLRQEFFNVSTRVGEIQSPFGATSISQIIARFEQDNLNRLNFPQRGHRVQLEASQSVNVFDTSINYFRSSLKWRAYFQLSESLVFLTASQIGYATSDLPLHRQFHLGGYPDFVGYRLYELGSSHIRMIQLGGRLEAIPNYFFSVNGNIASTQTITEIDFVNTPLRIGWSTSLGINTRIAPIKFSIMGSPRNPLMVYYSVGVQF